MSTIGASARIGYIAEAAQIRAARYRNQAVQLLKMAAAEPIGDLRQHLADLSNEYHNMAENIEERHGISYSGTIP